MKMTRTDLVNYLNSGITSCCAHKSIGDRLIICNTVFMNTINNIFTELPDKMTFETTCFMRNTPFKTLPDDIILNGSLSLTFSNLIELPSSNPLCISDNLYMNECKLLIPFGTYIGKCIYSVYHKFSDIVINGYIVSDGVLS